MTISVTIFINQILRILNNKEVYISVTSGPNLYAHVSPGMQKQAVDKFDEMMISKHTDSNPVIP